MANSRSRRVAPERELRRQQIITAAIRTFAERGVENVTFGDIAKAARLSRPLVYFYFADLPTLFLETILVASQELHRRFHLAARPALNGLEQIMAIGHAYVRFAKEEPALFQCLAHSEANQPPEQNEHPLHQECTRVFDGIMGVMVAALEKGRRDGSIRGDLGDPGKVAICLWGLVHGLIQLHATKQPTIEEKLGAGFEDLPEFGLGLVRRSLLPVPKTR